MDLASSDQKVMLPKHLFIYLIETLRKHLYDPSCKKAIHEEELQHLEDELIHFMRSMSDSPTRSELLNLLQSEIPNAEFMPLVRSKTLDSIEDSESPIEVRNDLLTNKCREWDLSGDLERNFHPEDMKFEQKAEIPGIQNVVNSELLEVKLKTEDAVTAGRSDYTSKTIVIGKPFKRKRKCEKMKKNFKAEIVGDISVKAVNRFTNVEDNLVKDTEKGVWKCNHCGFTGKLRNRVRLHIETHVTGLVFECNFCGKKFKTRSTLANHKRMSPDPDHHIPGQKKALVTWSVGGTQEMKLAAANDLVLKVDEGVYQCKQCGRTGKNSGEVKLHAERHIEGLVFPCPIPNCERTFNSRASLAQHKWSASDSSHQTKIGKKKKGWLLNTLTELSEYKIIS